jgi:hypothetical protein
MVEEEANEYVRDLENLDAFWAYKLSEDAASLTEEIEMDETNTDEVNAGEVDAEEVVVSESISVRKTKLKVAGPRMNATVGVGRVCLLLLVMVALVLALWYMLVNYLYAGH